MEMLEAAAEHQGSAFVEIYQNCNVFNDKAFIALTGKQERIENRINLEHGKPVVFGPNDEHGRDDLRRDRPHRGRRRGGYRRHPRPRRPRREPRRRLRPQPSRPTAPSAPPRSGCSAACERPTYEADLDQQIAAAQASKGPGDLKELVTSSGSWVVE